MLNKNVLNVKNSIYLNMIENLVKNLKNKRLLNIVNHIIIINKVKIQYNV